MDIDLSALRGLQTEKDISLDLSIKAIEDALLVAYHRSDGAATSARVEVNPVPVTSPCGPRRRATTAR